MIICNLVTIVDTGSNTFEILQPCVRYVNLLLLYLIIMPDPSLKSTHSRPLLNEGLLGGAPAELGFGQ